jgi:hypothetical protein
LCSAKTIIPARIAPQRRLNETRSLEHLRRTRVLQNVTARLKVKQTPLGFGTDVDKTFECVHVVGCHGMEPPGKLPNQAAVQSSSAGCHNGAKIENPNIEIRNNIKTPMFKIQNKVGARPWFLCFDHLCFGHLDLFRVSIFVSV